MTHRVRNLLAAALAVGSIASRAEALEPPPEPQEATPVSALNDPFERGRLDSAWSFDDPNHNDGVSLSARPGWLQFEVNGADEDIWQDGRGQPLTGRAGRCHPLT